MNFCKNQNLFFVEEGQKMVAFFYVQRIKVSFAEIFNVGRTRKMVPSFFNWIAPLRPQSLTQVI